MSSFVSHYALKSLTLAGSSIQDTITVYPTANIQEILASSIRRFLPTFPGLWNVHAPRRGMTPSDSFFSMPTDEVGCKSLGSKVMHIAVYRVPAFQP